MALSYYIYYRIARPREARACVERLQRGLRQQLGIEGRLLSKRDEPAVWMEIYDRVGDGAAFEGLLAALVDEAGFAKVLAAGSERKVECFEDAPCA